MLTCLDRRILLEEVSQIDIGLELVRIRIGVLAFA
jgi:hypothetical protein